MTESKPTVKESGISEGTIHITAGASIVFLLLLLLCGGECLFSVKKEDSKQKNIEVEMVRRDSNEERQPSVEPTFVESNKQNEVQEFNISLSSKLSSQPCFLRHAGIARHRELTAKFADLGVEYVEDFVWFGKNVTDAVMAREINMTQIEIAAFRDATLDAEEGKSHECSDAMGNDESAEFIVLLRMQRLLAEGGIRNRSDEIAVDSGLAARLAKEVQARGSGKEDVDPGIYESMNDEEAASFELLLRTQEMLSEQQDE